MVDNEKIVEIPGQLFTVSEVMKAQRPPEVWRSFSDEPLPGPISTTSSSNSSRRTAALRGVYTAHARVPQRSLPSRPSSRSASAKSWTIDSNTPEAMRGVPRRTREIQTWRRNREGAQGEPRVSAGAPLRWRMCWGMSLSSPSSGAVGKAGAGGASFRATPPSSKGGDTGSSASSAGAGLRRRGCGDALHSRPRIAHVKGGIRGFDRIRDKLAGGGRDCRGQAGR